MGRVRGRGSVSSSEEAREGAAWTSLKDETEDGPAQGCNGDQGADLGPGETRREGGYRIFSCGPSANVVVVEVSFDMVLGLHRTALFRRYQSNQVSVELPRAAGARVRSMSKVSMSRVMLWLVGFAHFGPHHVTTDPGQGRQDRLRRHRRMGEHVFLDLPGAGAVRVAMIEMLHFS